MASAAYELSAKYNIDITRRSTLLIDDDFRNIQIALKYKTPAIRFVPEDVDKLVYSYLYGICGGICSICACVRMYNYMFVYNMCMHVCYGYTCAVHKASICVIYFVCMYIHIIHIIY